MSRKLNFLFLKYLKFTMPIVYMTLGIVLLCFQDVLFSISGIYRIVFGVMLIVYGGFRFYQTFIKKAENEE